MSSFSLVAGLCVVVGDAPLVLELLLVSKPVGFVLSSPLLPDSESLLGLPIVLSGLELQVVINNPLNKSFVWLSESHTLSQNLRSFRHALPSINALVESEVGQDHCWSCVETSLTLNKDSAVPARD